MTVEKISGWDEVCLHVYQEKEFLQYFLQLAKRLLLYTLYVDKPYSKLSLRLLSITQSCFPVHAVSVCVLWSKPILAIMYRK